MAFCESFIGTENYGCEALLIVSFYDSNDYFNVNYLSIQYIVLLTFLYCILFCNVSLTEITIFINAHKEYEYWSVSPQTPTFETYIYIHI